MTLADGRAGRPWYAQIHRQALVALATGAAFGTWLPAAASAVGLLGDVFLSLLRMVIVPLVFTSLVSGVASLGDLRRVGRVGMTTLVHHTATNVWSDLVCAAVVTRWQTRGEPLTPG